MTEPLNKPAVPLEDQIRTIYENQGHPVQGSNLPSYAEQPTPGPSLSVGPREGGILPGMKHMALDTFEAMKRLQEKPQPILADPGSEEYFALQQSEASQRVRDATNVAGMVGTGGYARAAPGLLSGAWRGPVTELGTFAGAAGAERLYGKQAMRPILKDIEELEAKGFDPKEIGEAASEYAAEKGLNFGQIVKREDGLWRFEISDYGMKIKQPSEIKFIELEDGKAFNTTIGELIDHPNLFKAYPELKDVQVGVKKTDKIGGTYRDFDEDAGLKADISIRADSISDVLDTVVHEMQHYVQQVEEFSPGTSPKSMWITDLIERNKSQRLLDDPLISDAVRLKAYGRTLGEQEAEMVVNRRRMPASLLREVPADVNDPIVLVPGFNDETPITQMSIPRRMTDPSSFPEQGVLPIGREQIPEHTRNYRDRIYDGRDLTAPYPPGLDPSYTYNASRLSARQLKEGQRLLEDKTDRTVSALKKEMPDLQFDVEKSGSGSQYVHIKDGDSVILKFRLGDHAATSPDVVSIDPVTGNTIYDLVEILRYERGLTDTPPQIGWSYLPPASLRTAVNKRSGIELFPANRQIGGSAVYRKNGYRDSQKPYEIVSQEIGTDIQWRDPDLLQIQAAE